MAATSDESGTADDHAPYPLPRSQGPGAVRSPGLESALCADPPKGVIPCVAKLTPSRPSVKRGLVSKSLFSARKSALALFFTSV